MTTIAKNKTNLQQDNNLQSITAFNFTGIYLRTMMCKNLECNVLKSIFFQTTYDTQSKRNIQNQNYIIN